MSFIDPNDFEAVAIHEAGAMGGAYIGSENMNLIIPNDWTPKQWATLVETIVSGYISSLHDQHEQATRAAQKITILPPLGAGEFRAFNKIGADGEFPN